MLETRKVFIDTQYFHKVKFHFDSPALKSFRKLCEAGELLNITTSVVLREVESHIQSSVKEALTAMQKFKREAAILSSLDDENIKSLFLKIPEEDIYRKASAVFSEFIECCNTDCIEASDVDPEDILKLYFDRKPPFGEGKKKFEFPDALSLLSLKSSLRVDEKIYVISEDSDIKSFCESDSQLESIDSLEKMLDLYNQYLDKRTSEVKQYFVTNELSIKAKIKDYIEGFDVYNSSTWEDAEVDDFEVTNVGHIEPSIIYISDEESQVTFDIIVEYEVTVSGPDFNNGMYDSEDAYMYTFGTTCQTITRTNTYTVEIWLYYEFINDHLENVVENGFDIAGIANGIEVHVEENEGEYH